MKKLLAITTILMAISGVSMAGEKKGIKITGEVGSVGSVMTVGTSVTKGKYTADVHIGSTENSKKSESALSVGIYRNVLKLGKTTLGIGLSANQVKSLNLKTNLLKTSTYQGYDLQIMHDVKLFKKDFLLRGTINGNGDFKGGIGFSF